MANGEFCRNRSAFPLYYANRIAEKRSRRAVFEHKTFEALQDLPRNTQTWIAEAIQERICNQDKMVRERLTGGKSLTPEWKKYARHRGIITNSRHNQII